MQRRSFIRNAATGAAAGAALAAPAIVRAQPQIRWRLTSSFPKSLDTIFGASEVLSKRVSALTGGKFQISVHAAGEIVPGLQVLDAVQNGTVEAGHTALYYFFGKEPSWAIATAVPFGLNARQYNAWWYHGGGSQVFNEFARKSGVIAHVAGNTGAQMGGWFRKEINTLADVKGLKVRIAGLGGSVFERLGAVPQALPGGEIYPALERGAIDAAEWVGPYDDEKLGFYKVAKFYYYPGWWETGPQISFYVNKEQWEKLPKPYQAAFETAAIEANLRMMAAYDAKNPLAIQRLVQNGTQLRRYPDDVLKAAYEAAQKLYAEESAKNPDFKKLYDSLRAFQQISDIWLGLPEGALANFMQAQMRAKK